MLELNTTRDADRLGALQRLADFFVAKTEVFDEDKECLSLGQMPYRTTIGRFVSFLSLLLAKIVLAKIVSAKIVSAKIVSAKIVLAKIVFCQITMGRKLGTLIKQRVKWWSQGGSNSRPLECHSSALPAELWPRFGPQC